jgi:hypothetical protein
MAPCYVAQCESKTNHDKKLKFHRFPCKTNKKRIYEQWIANLKIRKTPSKHSRICELHFSAKDDYQRSKSGNLDNQC